MPGPAALLIALGVLFLAGLAADRIGQRTKLPRVTLLLFCGLLAGEPGFRLIPQALSDLYPLVSVVALTMIAFLLGSALSLETLRAHGRVILVVSLGVVSVTLLLVTGGLWLMGVPLAMALALGALSTATDPAATLDVIAQSGRDTPFTRQLKGIVAIDDAWALMAFSVAIVIAGALSGGGPDGGLIGEAAAEIALSAALGLGIGLPAAALTGRLSDGEPLRIEALGIVFLTAGLALWLDLSYLLCGMVAGATVVNLARHHTRAFHEIESLQTPFLIVFFILAGATLDPQSLPLLGLIGVAYIGLRFVGRLAGGLAGARLAGVSAQSGRWYGPALLPQAGVAIGMGLIAAEELPEHGDTIIAMAVGTTVIFELAGPLVTAWALRRAPKD